MTPSDRLARGARLAVPVLAGLLLCCAGVRASEPGLIEEVRSNGARHLSLEELTAITSLRAGDPLIPDVNRTACQSIVKRYREIGRPFATCELAEGGRLD